jgi:hypothetical protein
VLGSSLNGVRAETFGACADTWLACEGGLMDLVAWKAGVRTDRRLANRFDHGGWIEWVDAEL